MSRLAVLVLASTLAAPLLGACGGLEDTSVIELDRAALAERGGVVEVSTPRGGGRVLLLLEDPSMSLEGAVLVCDGSRAAPGLLQRMAEAAAKHAKSGQRVAIEPPPANVVTLTRLEPTPDALPCPEIVVEELCHDEGGRQECYPVARCE